MSRDLITLRAMTAQPRQLDGLILWFVQETRRENVGITDRSELEQ